MKKLDTIILTALGAVILLSLAIGLAGADKSRRNRRCSGIQVTVLDSAERKFISEKDVEKVLNRDFGGYVNRWQDSVNLYKIEKVLDKVGFIDAHHAYFTNDGILHIEITQRAPVARFRTDEKVFYLTSDGRCFEVGEDWCSTCIPISGSLPESDKEWMLRLGKTAEWILSSAEWCGKITRINCDKQGQVTIMLDEREEKFLIGYPDEIEKKFGRIDKYLSKIVPSLEEGMTYKTVSVKYNGQVVCR